jgi:hypothetical protein
MFIQRQYLYLSVLPIFVAAMMLVPWLSIFEEIYGYGFVDREVYVEYFLYKESVLEYKEFGGIFSYISNEFLWHYLMAYFINDIGVDIKYVFAFISILCLSVFGLIVVKNHGPFALLFLVNPLVVDFAFSQLRMALAISLLGISYLLISRQKFAALIFVACSLLIHTAAIFFVLIYMSLRICDRYADRFRNGHWAKFVLLCLVGASISMAIGPLRVVILSLIGDRRVEYLDMSSTLTYSLFWIILLFAIGGGAKILLKEKYQQFSVVILSIVAVNVFHGGYSTRFLAASFPFLVSTVLSSRGVYGVMVIFLFAFYAMLQWLFWLRLA